LAILKIVQEDPTLTLTDIGKKLKHHDPPFVTIPYRTNIQRYLDIEGWHSKDAPIVVHISSNNIMKRLVFAENHEEEDDDF
jgi:hypothetical protein